MTTAKSTKKPVRRTAKAKPAAAKTEKVATAPVPAPVEEAAAPAPVQEAPIVVEALPVEQVVSAVFSLDPMQETMQFAAKMLEDVKTGWDMKIEFDRRNAEVMNRAIDVAFAGALDLNTKMMQFAQDFLDARMKSAQTVMSADNVQEAINTELAYSQEALEKVMAFSAELGNQSMIVSEQSWAPINQRVEEIMDRSFATPAL
ncbi:MAG: phasin family protein [Magnetospiraceae bacterium]